MEAIRQHSMGLYHHQTKYSLAFLHLVAFLMGPYFLLVDFQDQDFPLVLQGLQALLLGSMVQDHSFVHLHLRLADLLVHQMELSSVLLFLLIKVLLITHHLQMKC